MNKFTIGRVYLIMSDKILKDKENGLDPEVLNELVTNFDDWAIIPTDNEHYVEFKLRDGVYADIKPKWCLAAPTHVKAYKCIICGDYNIKLRKNEDTCYRCIVKINGGAI